MNGNIIANFATAPTRRKIVMGTLVVSILHIIGVFQNFSFLGLNKVVPLGNISITFFGLLLLTALGVSLYWIWIGRLH